ncbi:protease modulator HflC [Chenggangzhangella methanolivorans]|uniref:protease modulator HflC n=1 Tax=Chenggangzhangella methanolivorans TaxID=1437009 RepID=UPI0028F40283|nr:protease modulator HflC [Chenggangzhangella methanolivorans]
MNKSIFGAAFAVIAFLVAVAGYSALYQVSETEQVIVLRLGQPVATVTEPGLHAKVPFIESVTRIDKRVLDLDLPEREATANDSQRLVVDAFSRYKITNALRFRQAVGTIEQANTRLTNVLTDALLEAIRSNSFEQIVRDRRDQIMARIRDQANREADRFGLQIVDVRIRRADLPEQNSKAVFDRMSSERAQEAAQIRARGPRRRRACALAPTARRRSSSPKRTATPRSCAARAKPRRPASSPSPSAPIRTSSPSSARCRPTKPR